MLGSFALFDCAILYCTIGNPNSVGWRSTFLLFEVWISSHCCSFPLFRHMPEVLSWLIPFRPPLSLLSLRGRGRGGGATRCLIFEHNNLKRLVNKLWACFRCWAVHLLCGMELFLLPRSEEEAVRFLQEKGVFAKHRTCSSNHVMKLQTSERRGYFWRCTKATCNNKRISIRDGTWFRYCSLPLVKALHFLFNWTLELSSGKCCAKQQGMQSYMTLEWNKCITEVLAEDLDRRPCRKIGGEGRIVEVDETVFAKHEHVSGKVVRSQWTVAGICRETGQSFLKMVPDRSANSFLDAIKENVSDGSIIYAYSWKGYKASQLEAAGFPQLTSNHRLNFVDPSTAEVAEELYDVVWGSDKWRSNHQTRSARQYQDSYLVEFVWRQEVRCCTTLA